MTTAVKRKSSDPHDPPSDLHRAIMNNRPWEAFGIIQNSGITYRESRGYRVMNNLVRAIVHCPNLELITTFVNSASLRVLNLVDGPTSENPLMAAARTKNLDVLELLLAKHADPNASNCFLMTPLRYAVSLDESSLPKSPGKIQEAELRMLKTVQSLIEHRANPEPEDIWGETPLQAHKTSCAFPSVIAFLTQKGADPESVQNSGESKRQKSLPTLLKD